MDASDIKISHAPLLPVRDMITALEAGQLDDVLETLGGIGGAVAQRARCISLARRFADRWGDLRPAALFTVSGRSELSGNHTDHNRGCVIACSISLDMLGVASPREDGIICLDSAGFGEDVVNPTGYGKPDSDRFGTSSSLIAGVCAGLVREGYRVGGFDACVTSDVLKGSGLSSSAAFEDMVGLIESHLWNQGRVDAVTLAGIAQYAENVFFGKPCGLMDQLACAMGGIVAIDFANPDQPFIQPIPFDMTAAGYHLCIVNTGGNHADLTDEYAAVPREMKDVASAFGCDVLRQVPQETVLSAIPTLRERLGDRAVLRALHFYGENNRVAAQKAALLEAYQASDSDARDAALARFFDDVKASGRSSFCYLQNVYTVKNVRDQSLSLALCLCESILGDKLAAWRVHGGGFAGTVQAWVPTEEVSAFRTLMDGVFGRGATVDLRVRAVGAARIL